MPSMNHPMRCNTPAAIGTLRIAGYGLQIQNGSQYRNAAKRPHHFIEIKKSRSSAEAKAVSTANQQRINKSRFEY
jgi:hypothetical protein